jgi:hypothetical protein
MRKITAGCGRGPPFVKVFFVLAMSGKQGCAKLLTSHNRHDTFTHDNTIKKHSKAVGTVAEFSADARLQGKINAEDW